MKQEQDSMRPYIRGWNDALLYLRTKPKHTTEDDYIIPKKAGFLEELEDLEQDDLAYAKGYNECLAAYRSPVLEKLNIWKHPVGYAFGWFSESFT